MDTISPEERSRVMSRVKSRDTRPEMIVRRLLHGMGYRYRLHVAGLPGRPDLVFRSRKKVIFVHGCFWHRHANCRLTTTPSQNREFWLRKFEENVRRDQRNIERLRELGWHVSIVWQCETKNSDELARRLRNELESATP